MSGFLNALGEVPVIEAGIAGSAIRNGLKGTGATKADVVGELHNVEAGAGVLAALGIVVAGAVAWGVFAWWSGPPARRGA